MDCNNTLPRGGVYWNIRPLRQFASRGLRDCPRAKPGGNLEGRGVQIAEFVHSVTITVTSEDYKPS